MSYNTHNNKLSLNEFISYCVQEEKEMMREMTKNAHLATSSQNKRKKYVKNFSQNKKANE